MKNINEIKKRGVLIVIICLSGIILGRLVNTYRGAWIYRYGSMISSFIFFGGVFLSLLNTILLISENRFTLKNNLIWLFISAIPFLYIIVIMCITAIKLAY